MGKKSKSKGVVGKKLEDLSEWRDGFKVDLSLQRRETFPFDELENNKLITQIGTHLLRSFPKSCAASVAGSGARAKGMQNALSVQL